MMARLERSQGLPDNCGIIPAEREPLAILVIDDDDVFRERLARILAQYADPVLLQEAGSKSEALDALARRPFHFVFLDFRLSDGDGRDLLPAIREGASQGGLIIAVTGAGSERAAADAIKSGIYDYLPKFSLVPERVYQVLDDGRRCIGMQQQLRASQAQLQHRSLYDSLTELPNRNLFFDRLEQACHGAARGQLPFAVMMIDLDRFKEVNDKLGHPVGDAVLCEVGRRFQALLRKSDTMARLGGDEFAALLMDVQTPQAVELVGQKIIDVLTPPILVQGHALSVGASIGAALCPLHAQVPGDLVTLADNAMYRAKRGIDKIVVHQDADCAARPAPPAQALIAELEAAIRQDELVMHYQPKMRLDTHEVVGFEALVRWRHASRGLLAPHHFVPTLESSPLLGAFTDKTVELALRQSAIWRARGREIKIAINISSRMLDDLDFVPRLLAQLDRFGVPAHSVSLELTETALLVNLARAHAMVAQLRAHDVALSIDDFGAGFTSFTYLRDFAVPEIKLDGSFVTELEADSFNASLVRSLSMLCSALGKDFIAEGVERRECWATLLALGCRIGQGYSIARPMPGEEVLSWLEDWESVPLALETA